MFCFRRIFRVNEDPKELMTKFGLAAFKKLIGKPWLNHSNLIQSKFGLYVEYVVPVLGHGHHGHARDHRVTGSPVHPNKTHPKFVDLGVSVSKLELQ